MNLVDVAHSDCRERDLSFVADVWAGDNLVLVVVVKNIVYPTDGCYSKGGEYGKPQDNPSPRFSLKCDQSRIYKLILH